MWSLAQRMANIHSKTRVNIQKPRGNPLWATPTRDCRSVFGYSLSFWIFTLVFREYFAIRFAKLHILPQSINILLKQEGKWEVPSSG